MPTIEGRTEQQTSEESLTSRSDPAEWPGEKEKSKIENSSGMINDQ